MKILIEIFLIKNAFFIKYFVMDQAIYLVEILTNVQQVTPTDVVLPRCVSTRLEVTLVSVEVASP